MPKLPKAAKAASGGSVVGTGTGSLPCVHLAEVAFGPKVDEPAWRCQQLWIAVLLAAVVDAAAPDRPNWRSPTDERHPVRAKSQARRFLRQPPPALLEFAGILPEAWPVCLQRLEARWAEVDAARRSGKASECAA